MRSGGTAASRLSVRLIPSPGGPCEANLPVRSAGGVLPGTGGNDPVGCEVGIMNDATSANVCWISIVSEL